MRILIIIFLLHFSSLVAAESKVTSLELELKSLDTLFDEYNTLKPTAWENWGLEEDEWKRYEFIIQNTPWGVWQHEATPFQVLAAYASTIAEKRRYARMEAKLDQWREDKAYTFQQIYNNEREIVFAKYRSIVKGYSPTIQNIDPGDKLAMFVDSTDCLARCNAVVSRVLQTGARVDIYMLNTQVENDIFNWAKAANVPVERVHTGQITLNFDSGVFKQVSNLPEFLAEFPVVFSLKNNGTYELIAL